MAFINFINISGGGGGDASAVTQDFTSTIERTVSSLTLPSGTTVVGQNAFASCSALTEVTIPAGVQTIEANAFAENRSLATITFESTTPPTVAADAFSQLPSGVTVNVPEGAEDAYSAVTEAIEDAVTPWVYLQDAQGGYFESGTTYEYADGIIPAQAFRNWGCVKVEMGKITEVGNLAFSRMYYLSALTLSTGITTIGQQAFAETYSLRGKVSLPSIEEIGEGGFKWSAIDSIEFGENLQTLGNNVFDCGNLTEMTFHTGNPDDLLNLGGAIGPITKQHEGVLKLDTGLDNFDLYSWMRWKAIYLPLWDIEDLEGNDIVPVCVLIDDFGNSSIYEPSGTTVDYTDPDLPTGEKESIYTFGITELGNNAFLNLGAYYYYFDKHLVRQGCTPLRYGGAMSVSYAAQQLDLQNFDGRLAENTDVNTVKFYSSVCPTKNLEHNLPDAVAQEGTLYIPEGGQGWHNMLISGLTTDWVVKDVYNNTNLGAVYITTSAGTDSYYYNQIPNARFINNSAILSVRFSKELTRTNGQCVEGCGNLSSVTIDYTGEFTVDGRAFYNCSALTEFHCYCSNIHVDGTGYFDGIASAGTFYIDTANTDYEYSNWRSLHDNYLPTDWVMCDLNGTPLVEPEPEEMFAPIPEIIEEYGPSPTEFVTFYLALDGTVDGEGRADVYVQDYSLNNGEGTKFYNNEGDGVIYMEDGQLMDKAHYNSEDEVWEYSQEDYPEDYQQANTDIENLGVFSFAIETVDETQYLAINVYGGYMSAEQYEEMSGSVPDDSDIAHFEDNVYGKYEAV